MNEVETRAEHVDPALKAADWGVVEGSRILREFRTNKGRLQGGGKRGEPEIADYVLVYRNLKLAIGRPRLRASRTRRVWQQYAQKLAEGVPVFHAVRARPRSSSRPYSLASSSAS